jgi:hypothetical protein
MVAIIVIEGGFADESVDASLLEEPWFVALMKPLLSLALPLSLGIVKKSLRKRGSIMNARMLKPS